MEESKKGKSNKGKIIFVVIILVIVLGAVVGFILFDKANTEKMNKAMETPALDYFDKYMSANTGASAYKVTLGMLKKANKEGENYDLKVLDKCSDEKTTATINIDYSNGKVTGTTVKLDCKKF